MADLENKRKCLKCGRSPNLDNVKLFRFPKPGIRNNLKCAAWAQFMFPEDPRAASSEFQGKLYNEHRMLCNHHFNDDDYTDISKRRLQLSAFPHDDEENLQVQYHADSAHPSIALPGPSQLRQSQSIAPAGLSQPDASRAVTSQLMPSSSGSLQQRTQRAPLKDTTNLFELSSSGGKMADPETQPAKKRGNTKREEFLLKKCTKNMKNICLLQKKIRALKRKEQIDQISEDMAVKRLSKRITPAFALLLQGQLRNCKKKKKSGRRWTKEEKLTSLRIYKRSPTCYRLLKRMFCLPSVSTLKAELNKVPLEVGINKAVFNVLKQNLPKSQDNVYTLMFDEMSLKKHLRYNPRQDKIEGFQDHGAQGRSAIAAGYALVFMIAGVRKRVKQPLAHYFSSGFSTADRLVALIKEVLYECFQAGLHIAAIVCDMDGVNRRALNILGASADHPYIMVHDREIISFFDTPHLLKCFRNMWMKYDIECSADISSDMSIGRGTAKWDHIKEFFKLDNMNANFVYAPLLKKDHLEPNSKQKMKVDLAAQVLSHSVAGGIFNKVAEGKLPASAVVTANICCKMDELFDALNADSSHLKRGKPYSTNLKETSPHLELMKKMRSFFMTMKYVGCPRKPPSQEGWVWTINAMIRLWRVMSTKYGAKSLSTRRVQQDPLENMFGVIRGNCGSNTNPTSGQFAAALKTAILTNIEHIGTRGNCEPDNNEILNNLSIFLCDVKTPQSCSEREKPVKNKNYTEMAEGIEESFNEEDGETQACAYVCGFLLKRLQTQCILCKKSLVTDKVESIHMFVESREYQKTKTSLQYASKSLIKCVEYCATITNSFLKDNAHLSNLNDEVTKLLIEVPVDFSFLDACIEHKFENISQIMNSVFAICVKRFCILKNREFSQEASAASLKRKMKIILHK